MAAERSRCLIAGLALTGLASVSLAQETPPAQPVAAPPAAQPEPKPQPSQPTLDDLLGIGKDKQAKPNAKPDAKPRPEAADPTRNELDRKLSAREVAEQFKVAIDLMADTADRLQTSRDTSLTTQRIQEDIIRKLDQLIKSAEQNQQQSRSRSKPQQQQQQQQPNQQQQNQQRNPNGVDPASDTIDPPARQADHLNPGAAPRGAAWGNLPDRLRGALLQGDADKYSSWYKQWTESYYKRLAEDAGK